jgi:cyclophilin family peptidyl-prolyl cis-trans isomerase
MIDAQQIGNSIALLASPRTGTAASRARVGATGTIAYARHVATRSLRSARLFALSSLTLLYLSGCGGSPAGAGNPKVPAGARSSGGNHATITTDKGPIEIELLASDTPKGVENFRLLAEHGYYNGLTFHRIVKGFMIQGGDPAGDGTGGESAWGGTFEDEINPSSPLYSNGYKRGLIAYANAGPNTNGSQFFILHDDYPLPPRYVIFARVTSGMDVIDDIAETPTTMGADGARSKPLTPPVIKAITIKP